MKQPVLVLGANGFIGGRVVERLARTEWAEPVAGVRRDGRRVNGAGRTCVVDVTNAESIRNVLSGMCAVVNCTALAPDQILSSAEALFSAVQGDKANIRVIQLSSMAVYGSATGLVDEAAPLLGDLGDYSAAKVAAELVAARYPRTVTFRPGLVYGPGSEQWSVRFARYLLAHRLGDLGPAGDGYCNLVHVEDVATAIVNALQSSGADGQAFNLSLPDPPTWNEYLVRFARSLRAVPVRRISGRRLKIEMRLLAPPLKIGEIVARRCRVNPDSLPPPIPPSLGRLMSQEIRLSTVRVERELQMRWTDLDAGLDETARRIIESRQKT